MKTTYSTVSLAVRQRPNQRRQRQTIERLTQDNYELVVSLHWDIKTQLHVKGCDESSDIIIPAAALCSVALTVGTHEEEVSASGEHHEAR